MAMLIPLTDRSVLQLRGKDTRNFLQGLITNDVRKVTDEQAIFAAMLNAQGKLLHDFFLLAEGDDIYLEGEAGQMDALTKLLSLYKLRADVTLQPAELKAYALIGPDAHSAAGLPGKTGAARHEAGVQYFTDPRLAEMGVRILAEGEGVLPAEWARGKLAEYEAQRIALGIPEGSHDTTSRTFPMDHGLDQLQGIDFAKGCYVGQEVTARMHYKGITRKAILQVSAEGALPIPGTEITAGDTAIGELRSVLGTRGLAAIRLDNWRKAVENNEEIRAGELPLTLSIPAWFEAKWQALQAQQ